MSENDENGNEFGGDDFDAVDFDDGGFEDFKGKGTLGDIWRNNPLVKIGVILAAFAFIVGGVILFGGKKENPLVSRVTRSTEMTETPGTAEVSPAYAEAIKEENTRRVEEALRTDSSALPMPSEPSKGTLPLQLDDPEAEDPLERWRRMQEERIRQQQIISAEPPIIVDQPPPVDTRTPAVNALSQAMVQQMELVLENQAIPETKIQQVASISYLENLQAKKAEKLQQMQQQLGFGSLGSGLDTAANILIPAGTIEYGQLITEANTDVPGPVLAQIVSGPLRGSKLLGTFTSSEDFITLNFNQVVIDGVSQAANAVAVDPATTLPGMVTDIDRRYFSRIVLPMAAEFISGFAEAVSDSGTTTVFIQGDTVSESTSNKDDREEVASGITEAGDALSDILQKEADSTKPLLRIERGTPIGILFVQPVIEDDGTQATTNNTNTLLPQQFVPVQQYIPQQFVPYQQYYQQQPQPTQTQQ